MQEIYLLEKKYKMSLILNYINEIIIILTSSIKLMVAIPISYKIYQLDLLQTIILSISGGVFGILFFSIFSKPLKKIFPVIKKKKKGMTDVLVIKIIRKYGLIGLTIISPVLLSIPVGTLLALHLFPNKKKTIFYLIISVVMWSLILSFLWSKTN